MIVLLVSAFEIFHRLNGPVFVEDIFPVLFYFCSSRENIVNGEHVSGMIVNAWIICFHVWNSDNLERGHFGEVEKRFDVVLCQGLDTFVRSVVLGRP